MFSLIISVPTSMRTADCKISNFTRGQKKAWLKTVVKEYILFSPLPFLLFQTLSIKMAVADLNLRQVLADLEQRKNEVSLDEIFPQNLFLGEDKPCQPGEADLRVRGQLPRRYPPQRKHQLWLRSISWRRWRGDRSEKETKEVPGERQVIQQVLSVWEECSWKCRNQNRVWISRGLWW